MDVLFGVIRRVVLDDPVDGGDVEAPRSHVRAEQRALQYRQVETGFIIFLHFIVTRLNATFGEVQVCGEIVLTIRLIVFLKTGCCQLFSRQP